MNKYIILTESGADLSSGIIKQHDIQVLPMHVVIGDMDYLDGSISIDELRRYYDKTGKIPTTSAVSPYEYQEIYEKITADYPESIVIHISYSSKLSSTFQNSLIADLGMNNIHHIDSLNVSGGLAFVVMRTIALIEEQPDMMLEELIDHMSRYAALTRFCFIPGNLDYLRAGGRVSNASYLGATLLKLRPLIETVDGKLISTRKYRGSMKSIARQMIRGFFSKYKIDKKKICLVCTSGIDEVIKSDMENCVRELGAQEIVWLESGCVITAHAGPGGIGVAAMEKT